MKVSAGNKNKKVIAKKPLTNLYEMNSCVLLKGHRQTEMNQIRELLEEL